jgi:putative transposase
MKYATSEKLEIIRLVEQTHLPSERRWKSSASHGRHFTDCVIFRRMAGWRIRKINRPGRRRSGTAFPTRSVMRLCNLPSTSPNYRPRELAARFTDTKSYFVSEAPVYRLLKAHDGPICGFGSALDSARALILD